jgi:DNA-binding winged helix-turn-helix (wHTH) protein
VSRGYLAVETHLLNRPDLPDHLDGEPVWPLEQVPPPGQDATLLAVVPIPGTGTSLAIVGYAIATSAIAQPAPTTLSQGAPAAQAITWAAAPDGGAAEPAAETGASGLQLDKLQRRVWADGREIMLTFQEFELLAFLSAHPVTVFTRADLVARLWDCSPAREKRTRQHRGRVAKQEGRTIQDDSRTVDVHISRIRHKLGRRYGQCLVTEYRVGYQFRPLIP